MPTNQDEKPAKPRTRSRKTSGQKTAKAGAKAQILREHAQPDQVTREAEAASPVIARLEDAAVDVPAAETTPVELAAAEVVSDVAPLDVVPETAPVAVALEEVQAEKVRVEKVQEEKAREETVVEQMVQEAALNGEVLPPAGRDPVPQAASLSAIAHAYGEYTRKSWLNGRSLVERLMAMRSLDEAIEIQGEFAKQAYANFIVHSERICGLYGQWAQQAFSPLEKFAAGWPRIGR
jgi:phasin protein